MTMNQQNDILGQRRFICVSLALLLFGAGTLSADWTHWRGDLQQGNSTETGLPVERVSGFADGSAFVIVSWRDVAGSMAPSVSDVILRWLSCFEMKKLSDNALPSYSSEPLTRRFQLANYLHFDPTSATLSAIASLSVTPYHRLPALIKAFME